MTELLERWRSAIAGVGATADEPTVTAAGMALIRRWSEPHRHYHTLAHLTAVLAVVDAHAHTAAAPDRVRLAAWWHDAVYDPRATGDANERASAALAERTLRALGVAPEGAAEVARLVLLTARHEVGSDDPDGAKSPWAAWRCLGWARPSRAARSASSWSPRAAASQAATYSTRAQVAQSASGSDRLDVFSWRWWVRYHSQASCQPGDAG